MDLLECLFPDQPKSLFQELLEKQGKSVEECIQFILEEEVSLIEGDEELLTLNNMFPFFDFEVIYEKYILSNMNMEETVEALLTIQDESDTTKKAKIRLPKLSTASSSGFRWTPDALNCAKQLSAAFPQFDEESVRDMVEKHQGVTGLAAKELADLSCREENVKKRQEDQLSRLSIMFEGAVSLSQLRKVVQKGGSMEENVEAVLSIVAGNESAWEKPLKQDIHKSDEKDLLQFHSPKKPNLTSESIIISAGNMNVKHEVPRVLRENASALALQRNQLFERAAASFKKGQLTGLSSASYYAEKGRDFDAQFKALNHKAFLAQLEFNKRVHNYDESIIDLHGLSVKESILALKEKMDGWNTRTPLRIITGAGSHSKGGKGVLFVSSQNYVLKQGWKIDYNNIGNGWFLARK